MCRLRGCTEPRMRKPNGAFRSPFCNTHHRRWYKGERGARLMRPLQRELRCAYDGCPGRVGRSGLCARHFEEERDERRRGEWAPVVMPLAREVMESIEHRLATIDPTLTPSQRRQFINDLTDELIKASCAKGYAGKADVLTTWKQGQAWRHEVYVNSGTPDPAMYLGNFHRVANTRSVHLNSREGDAPPLRRGMHRNTFAAA